MDFGIVTDPADHLQIVSLNVADVPNAPIGELDEVGLSQRMQLVRDVCRLRSCKGVVPTQLGIVAGSYKAKETKRANCNRDDPNPESLTPLAEGCRCMKSRRDHFHQAQCSNWAFDFRSMVADLIIHLLLPGLIVVAGEEIACKIARRIEVGLGGHPATVQFTGSTSATPPLLA